MGTSATKPTCGDCSMCCIVLGIPEIDKPANKRCKDLCAGGCGIYAKRPPVCRDFECLWLQGAIPDLAGELRPDKVGLMFGATTDGKILIAYECWSGAKDAPRAQELLGSIAAAVPVIIVSGSKRQLLGPAAEVKRLIGRISFKKVGGREALMVEDD